MQAEKGHTHQLTARKTATNNACSRLGNWPESYYTHARPRGIIAVVSYSCSVKLAVTLLIVSDKKNSEQSPAFSSVLHTGLPGGDTSEGDVSSVRTKAVGGLIRKFLWKLYCFVDWLRFRSIKRLSREERHPALHACVNRKLPVVKPRFYLPHHKTDMPVRAREFRCCGNRTHRKVKWPKKAKSSPVQLTNRFR